MVLHAVVGRELVARERGRERRGEPPGERVEEEVVGLKVVAGQNRVLEERGRLVRVDELPVQIAASAERNLSPREPPAGRRIHQAPEAQAVAIVKFGPV